LPLNVGQSKASTQYRYTLTYKFENRGENSIELYEDDLTIPLFLETSYQTVKIESSTHDLKSVIMDEDGNKGALIDIDRILVSKDTFNFNVTYIIESKSKQRPQIERSLAQGFNSIPDKLVEEYSLPSETFTIDDPTINKLAQKFPRDDRSVLETIEIMLEWFKENTIYSNFEIPLYPSKTLKEGLGDCDDQAILFITMCRSIGIPAYLQIGVLIHSSINDNKTSWNGHLTSIQNGVGWHGWAMVYIPPWGWLPVDLTLTQSEEGINILKKSPVYEANIIPALNISKQPYIGDALATRERISNSTLYITVNDEAQVSNHNPFWVNYGIIGLGLAVLLSILLMYRSSSRQ
jgi:transglutaminase-like putative cysteine protease